MGKQVSYVCDGCGEEIVNGSLASALVVQVYRRGGPGEVDELAFSWDDADPNATPPRKSCGQRVVEALRAEFDKPALSVTNEGTVNPSNPGAGQIPFYTPIIPVAPGPEPITSPPTPAEP